MRTEKISAMKTSEFFVERQAQADFAAFNPIMSRSGGNTVQLAIKIKMIVDCRLG
jgi:hypothetical protein